MTTEREKLIAALRYRCGDIRRKPYQISDVIPMMQQAAYMLAADGDKKPTGWDNGLSQDYNAKLSAWYADRLGAREQLRQDFPAVPEADPFAGDHQDDIDGPTWLARIKQYWSELWK